MGKLYQNKDYTIYKVTASGLKEHMEFGKFTEKFYGKFCVHSGEKLWEMFDMRLHEARVMFIERDYNFMTGTFSDKRHFVIGNDEKEMLNFFNKHAPMKYLKEVKRLIGLQSYGEFRECLEKDFESQIDWLYTDGYKEKVTREEKLGKILD